MDTKSEWLRDVILSLFDVSLVSLDTSRKYLKIMRRMMANVDAVTLSGNRFLFIDAVRFQTSQRR
jgi:hypothetical protein